MEIEMITLTIRLFTIMLALIAFTPSAQAFVGGVGDDFCLDITTVAEEVETALDDGDLDIFGESECKKICKEAKNFCTDMVSSRQDCSKDSNKLDDKVDQLDKETLYICYCERARLSATAAFLLSQMGYEVAVLQGGLGAVA